jgi:hypothetical protein
MMDWVLVINTGRDWYWLGVVFLIFKLGSS